MMDKLIQIYVNVDENGEITNAQTGEYLIPAEEWSYFFLKSTEVAGNVYDHKVVITNMKPELVLKDVV